MFAFAALLTPIIVIFAALILVKPFLDILNKNAAAVPVVASPPAPNNLKLPVL